MALTVDQFPFDPEVEVVVQSSADVPQRMLDEMADGLREYLVAGLDSEGDSSQRNLVKRTLESASWHESPIWLEAVTGIIKGHMGAAVRVEKCSVFRRPDALDTYIMGIRVAVPREEIEEYNKPMGVQLLDLLDEYLEAPETHEEYERAELAKRHQEICDAADRIINKPVKLGVSSRDLNDGYEYSGVGSRMKFVN